MNRNWKEIRKFEEILFESYNGIAKITINRARYRNAFTPKTTWELSQAFAMCREMQDISVVLLTGAMSEVPEGKTLADVKHAFCSGGDMHVKGRGGYVDEDGVPRLSVLDVQMQIRRLPKPVIAMVNGYAIGGGHVLHLVCDLTIASERVLRSAPSMLASVPLISPVSWVRRKPVRSGSSVVSTLRRRLRRWVW